MVRIGAIAVTAVLLLGVASGSNAPGAAIAPPSGNKFPLPDSTPRAPGSAVPSQRLGTFSVRALQGTPGGPAIERGHVQAVFVHRGTPVHRVEGELDDFGVAVFEGIPVEPPVVPYVLFERDGAIYEGVGTLMNDESPDQQLDITCFEPTAEAPDWHIAMRHLMVNRDPAGVMVTEVVVISCPGDRTWIGAPDAAGRPTTVALALPAGATDVSLVRGFRDWSTTSFDEGVLGNHLPLVPGTSELQFRYRLPGEAERTELVVAAPVRTDQLMLVVPSDMVAGETSGLEPAGIQPMGGVDYAAFQASALPQGGDVRVPLATGVSAPRGDRRMMKVVVGIATGAALLFTIAVIFSRPRAAGSAS